MPMIQERRVKIGERREGRVVKVSTKCESLSQTQSDWLESERSDDAASLVKNSLSLNDGTTFEF